MNHDPRILPSSYSRALNDIPYNILSLILPSFDEGGVMVRRIRYDKLDPRVWSKDQDERAYMIAWMMYRERTLRGDEIPTTKDYAKGRDE